MRDPELQPSDIKPGLKVRLHPMIRREHDGKIYEIEKTVFIKGFKQPMVTLVGMKGPYCLASLSLYREDV